MRSNRFTDALLDALPNEAGHTGVIVGTGGGCTAVEVTYHRDGAHLLITNGDASIPDGLTGDGDGVWIADYADRDRPGYPAYDDDVTAVWLPRVADPVDVARVVSSYLNGGDWRRDAPGVDVVDDI